ncbi:MAG: hypothetical protein ACYC55_05055 [Candidatus Geothermincolia bacterium]
MHRPLSKAKLAILLIAVLLLAAAPFYGIWRVTRSAYVAPPRKDMQKVTQAEREAAAERAAAAGADVAVTPMIGPGDTPDYFGSPNYALSPLPQDDGAGGVAPGTGIRKFMDGLPGLGVDKANNLGQYIPVAIPDKTTFPGSDYYEIEVGEYTEQLHRDLPPTTLRGYRQTNTTDATVSVFNYLGPLIEAQRDTPVRIKFTNSLPSGVAGDLFLPVDKSVMGAGMGPMDMPGMPGMKEDYTENRATLHLHGGFVPWISDGTPHQWTTPADETTMYPKGVSVQYVPDMWFDAAGNVVPEGTAGATNDPGDGSLTFYYNNQQSARLQFYHDHSYGITRLNVYAGEAAPYIIRDTVEAQLIADGIIPADEIPLVIQDKTFVPDDAQLQQQDPTWDKALWGGLGSLWMPHVYMPNQNPADPGGMNAFGRWHYGPWFWPPTNNISNGPVPNPYYDPVNAPWENETIPGTPNPSMAMESFMDTPVLNGTAYPTTTVDPKAYRFRILNAGDDRFYNLQMYEADPAVVTPDGRTDTEVKMVPAVATPGYPELWPTDGREGGVPDPATMGPEWIQIGNDGGMLPQPAIIPNQPITWNLDPTNFNFGNVAEHSLLLGTAERADVVVDFSAYAGKTLILYNDAPAAFPARDPRYDYYTGAPDLSDTGGAPGVLAGYGPNIRTIMQIRVNAAPVAPSLDLAGLQAAFASTATTQGVFAATQDPILIPDARYNSAYNKTFKVDTYARIFDTQKTFQTVSGATVTVPFQPKAIQDEMGESFDMTYGRMSGSLGLELPNTGAQNQNFILYPYGSPPVDMTFDNITPSEPVAGDNTQIWKITHNGVDTHTIHVHLFNAQLLNRVAWDNKVMPPDDNELGWKETIRVNPLEDTVIALRPVAPTQPFEVPNSIRPIDPTMPVGDPLPGPAPTGGWFDTMGNPVTVTNEIVNFGWEYVWHCHLLSHEEMDMMHSLMFVTPPPAPSGLTAALGNSVVLNWTDNSRDETEWVIQRAEAAGGPWSTIATIPSATPAAMGGQVTYTDQTVADNNTYWFRVLAQNVVGMTQAFAAPAVGFPHTSAQSAPSNEVSIFTTAAIATQPFYFAEGSCRPGFNPYFTIQNPGTAAANVRVTYMLGNGTNREQLLTVPAGSRGTLDAKAFLGEANDVAHDFSAKVESTNGVDIVPERPIYFNYQGKSGSSCMVGTKSPATTFYFAEGSCRNGFTPYFSILNPGATDAAIRITYQMGNNTTRVQNVGVAKNSRGTIDIRGFLGSGAGAAYDFSAKVESTNAVPLVVERPSYFEFFSLLGLEINGGHCVMGATQLGSNAFFAEGSTRLGFEEYLCLQNPNASAITVNASYQLGAGQGGPVNRVYNLPANSRTTVPVYNEVGLLKDVSVKLTSTSTFLAERPIYFRYSYSGLSVNDGSCVIGVPAPAADWYLAEGATLGGFHEWLTLQNPNAQASTVAITYMVQGSGPQAVKTVNVPANGRTTIFVNQHAGANLMLSAHVTVTAGPGIIVERPVYANYFGWDGGHSVVGYRP